MFGTLGLPEILIILVIGVLIFGGVKLPGIFRSLSSGVRGFRKVRDTVRNPIDLDRWIVDEEPEQGPPSQQQYYGYNRNPQGYGPDPGWQGQPPWQQGPGGWGPGGQAPWPPPQAGFSPQGQQPPPQWGPPNGPKPPPQWGPPNGPKPPDTSPRQGGPQNPDQNSDPPQT
jgi:TatA/E family protein of Tat protein translocase